MPSDVCDAEGSFPGEGADAALHRPTPAVASNVPGPGRWSGAALLLPGVLAYAGAIGPTERHAHHAVQLMVAAGELRVVDDHGRVHTGGRMGIPSDTGHAITAGAQPAVALFIDPESALGSAVENRLGASWADTDVLAGLDPASGDPRAAVSALTRSVGAGAVRPARHPGVSAALELLPELIAQGPVRTGTLAERVGISTSRLTHVFTDQVGLPLRRYVLWLRVMTAVARTAAGDDVTAAAHAAGFADSAHLSRTCRATFGLPPSALSRTVRVEIGSAI
ncbi:helix-turn-helix domain-containing protein [Nocardia mikamii]|uniref:helix-turn-helix domain-containing protein n=1 Tax=Nocardia mikamii TaxID=508464 RepID=UPI000A07A6BB|nr:AraC family transcriptional regulator [Nocardia mikamii]